MITNVFLKSFLKEVALIRFTNKNLQKLVNEMFKVNNGLSVQLVIEHFYFMENHYNFKYQSGTKFKVEHVKTETNGKQSVSCLGTKTWNSIPRHCAKSFQIRRFFLSVFSCIWIEYGDFLRKSPYSFQIQENTDQKDLYLDTFYARNKKRYNSSSIQN